jgi:hypothetical protein
MRESYDKIRRRAESLSDPLIGIVAVEDDRETVRYYFREEDAEAETSRRTAQQALGLAGAWSDLNRSDVEEGLNRIRHESGPSEPLRL